MLQRGGVWLVGAAMVVGCGGPREAPVVDGGGSSSADAQGGDAPTNADWPASDCPGATDIANVGTLTRQHAFVPHLVRAGARTGMLWSGATAASFEIKFAWLDDAMRVVPGTTVVVSPDDGAFSAFGRIAWSGSELGVVYEDARHGDDHHDAYFARLDASGTPIAGSEIELGDPASQSVFPTVAWDPVDAQWGVAWEEWPANGQNRAWFARIDARGARIGGSQIALTDPAGVIMNPDADGPLIWSGTHWAIAWVSNSATVISEIPALGGPVHDIRLAEAPDTFELGPSIATDGARYLLGWVTWHTSAHQVDISLVDAHGFVPGTRATLGATTLASVTPSIAFNGSQFAVSFRAAVQQTDSQIWMALVDLDGGIVPGSERALTCDGQRNEDNVTSWHGAELDIVYTAQDPSGNNSASGPEVNDLRVVRVPGGAVQ